ncbi:MULTISPECIES: transglycosylase domain-containing protein [Alphaproteobacteria]|uniref:Penicillin-binding protein n=2 Tax=Alphaproteobacteria TaxID=28211 RepID=A0A512HIR7_9HYPH|nr:MULTISPECIES: transglycosylase domain-containing protein [Alphaproteobacteria]GEO85361.1 penicillin-binding protein [Ciceribacter naphthalenivorans]GLR21000.1 penicillin-binding protein [Ciceribacter naphthalenivorans]GLT03856.1 penicillin-binding protein [Sphingomonas psychrolutea]
MALKGKSRKRVEPTFQGEPDDDEEIRLDAGDRIGGKGTSRSTRQQAPKSPKSASTPRERRGGAKPKRRARGLTGLLGRVIYWCIVLGIWGAIGVGGIVMYYGARMPSASSWSIPERPPNLKVLSVEGTVIANRGATGGEALALEDMSPFIPQAVIAIEDRRFYSHFGVDPLGLARAVVTNLISRRTVQGGSTLTQQLAKNLFLSPERTIERKIQEVLLSFWLEHKFTKDQILAMYLNRVYFGSNAYGVEAASRRYFSKSARDVNLGEAALLAGLLKAPSRLSPARDPQAAEARAQVVLGAMREEGYISDDEIKTAMSQTPTTAKRYWTGASQYVADMVVEETKRLVGTISEDLVVETTIDMGLEKKAEAVIVKALDTDGAKLNASQAALVSIDGTGAIRALVGGKDYAESQFNRAVKAKRQPGSAFKPFVYAAALENGIRPDSIRNDAPVRIGKWTPENYDQKYRGPVTLSQALANSLNTIAAQLVMEVGPDHVIKLAHRLGIESELQANASIALGTSEVSLLELTAAYAPFMNGGYKATPHIIRRISNADGKVLYENDYAEPPRVLGEPLIADMNRMLKGVITDGTGKKARLSGWEAAGKSGTTQSFRDALFVGYTSNLTTGVWFGNDDGQSMKKVTGGGLPAKAWHDFMTAAHAGLTPDPLSGSDYIEPQPEPMTIGTILSDVFSGGETRYPAAPGTPAARQSDLPPTGIPQGDPYRPQAGGPIPPADVGGDSPVQPANRRTTLLDLIMGQ